MIPKLIPWLLMVIALLWGLSYLAKQKKFSTGSCVLLFVIGYVVFGYVLDKLVADSAADELTDKKITEIIFNLDNDGKLEVSKNVGSIRVFNVKRFEKSLFLSKLNLDICDKTCLLLLKNGFVDRLYVHKGGKEYAFWHLGKTDKSSPILKKVNRDNFASHTGVHCSVIEESNSRWFGIKNFYQYCQSQGKFLWIDVYLKGISTDKLINFEMFATEPKTYVRSLAWYELYEESKVVVKGF